VSIGASAQSASDRSLAVSRSARKTPTKTHEEAALAAAGTVAFRAALLLATVGQCI